MSLLTRASIRDKASIRDISPIGGNGVESASQIHAKNKKAI